MRGTNQSDSIAPNPIDVGVSLRIDALTHDQKTAKQPPSLHSPQDGAEDRLSDPRLATDRWLARAISAYCNFINLSRLGDGV
jgi:hypothetical protein